jgi:hypothetical protein
MRTIEVQKFYSKDLQKKVEDFNQQAEALDSERTTLEADLAQLKADALSGDVDGLATLGKRRDGLKSRLLNNLIQAVKLAEGRGQYQAAISKAYADELKARQEALTTREAEVDAIFQREGLGTRLLQGVRVETCQPLKGAVQEVTQPPKIETETDKALITELRRRISELL